MRGFPGQGLPDICAEDPENCVDANLIKQHADILAQPEWRAAGYEYVNVIECSLAAAAAVVTAADSQGHVHTISLPTSTQD